MGYDVHITRQENWFDNEPANIITMAEWLSAINADADMRLDNFAEAKTANGETIQTYSEGLAVWTKYSGNGVVGNYAWFDYNDGNITCKNPDDEIIQKMIELSLILGAKVQGDEGELFEL